MLPPIIAIVLPPSALCPFPFMVSKSFSGLYIYIYIYITEASEVYNQSLWSFHNFPHHQFFFLNSFYFIYLSLVFLKEKITRLFYISPPTFKKTVNSTCSSLYLSYKLLKLKISLLIWLSQSRPSRHARSSTIVAIPQLRFNS